MAVDMNMWGTHEARQCIDGLEKYEGMVHQMKLNVFTSGIMKRVRDFNAECLWASWALGKAVLSLSTCDNLPFVQQFDQCVLVVFILSSQMN